MPACIRNDTVKGMLLGSILTVLVLGCIQNIIIVSSIFTTKEDVEAQAIRATMTTKEDVEKFDIYDYSDCLLKTSEANFKLYSQNNEDGALLHILRCLGGHGTKEFFEFGSEDATEVNTRVLRELFGWKGHYLDGGYENPNIGLHKEWFTPTNIVSLLQRYKASKTLDVLSVDTDYDDFYTVREILRAGYKPRVLILEYNVNFFDEEDSYSAIAIPKGQEAIGNPWHAQTVLPKNGVFAHKLHSCYYGASATALIKLAGAFGYTTVFRNDVNIMLVQADDAKARKLLLPSRHSLPFHNGRSSLHSDCSGFSWAKIDDDVIKLATDKDLDHYDFVDQIKTVKLVHKQFSNNNHIARVFFEV